MSVRRTERPLIVPIFIPNMGCPRRCIFCQQEKITAQSNRAVNGRYVKETIDQAIKSPRFDSCREREVAFYGGTFTSLSINRMTELLEAVNPYLRQGFFGSIRVSTRPDEIDDKRLDLIKGFGVSTVELGVQSMDDEVLRLSQRGHTVRDTFESVNLLKRHGFKVGIQLMPGLPGDSQEIFDRTIEEVIRLRPDIARLYPAIVINGTELARWYHDKKYEPLTLEEAIRICQESCIRLESKGIRVIRIGLMSSPSLLQEGQIVAGPWHKSFGFLVRSSIHQKMIEPYLLKPGQASKIGLRAPSREVSVIRGYKNRGLRLIEAKTGAKIVHIKPDDSVPSGQVRVDVINFESIRQ
ncbi:MAG: radical SAM protein [Deltaproteobacteria bacterium]|nr:radical SAM protein [Deltaproteobacteria bacterium]